MGEGIEIPAEVVEAVAAALEPLMPEADRDLVYAETAIRACLSAWHASEQKRMLYQGSDPVGKGRRIVTAWRPV